MLDNWIPLPSVRTARTCAKQRNFEHPQTCPPWLWLRAQLHPNRKSFGQRWAAFVLILMLTGPDAHPVWKWLKAAAPDTTEIPGSTYLCNIRARELQTTPCEGSDVQWVYAREIALLVIFTRTLPNFWWPKMDAQSKDFLLQHLPLRLDRWLLQCSEL